MKVDWKKIFFVTIVLLFPLIIALSWVLSSMIMFPKRIVCNEQAIVFCGDPSHQGIDFEAFKIETKDQMEIHGWLMPAPGSKDFVILSHGRGSDRREGMRFAKSLIQAGFNIVVFDYRNSGESTQSFNSLGYFEKKDLEAVVTFAVIRGAEKVGVYGFSQGAATAIRTMAEDLRINAGAFEGAFSSALETVAEVAWSQHSLPEFPFIFLASAMFSLRTGISLSNVNPALDISKVGSRPVYLIHALGDSVVLARHSRKLLEKVPKAKTWFFDDFRHVQSWQFDKDQAELKIKNFFLESFASTNPM